MKPECLAHHSTSVRELAACLFQINGERIYEFCNSKKRDKTGTDCTLQGWESWGEH